jgi:PAS domain S-box-containing protein
MRVLNAAGLTFLAILVCWALAPAPGRSLNAPLILLLVTTACGVFFGVVGGLVAAGLSAIYTAAAPFVSGIPPSGTNEQVIETLELILTAIASVILVTWKGRPSNYASREKVTDRFRTLFQADIIGFFIGDFQGNIVEANGSFRRMLKYDDGIDHKLRWDTLTPKEYYSVDEAKYAELSASNRCEPWRKELIARDGSRIPVLVGMVRLPDDPKLEVGLVVNISELESAERDLQKLAGRILNLYDDERRNIARELHDTTAQNLAALSMNLTMLAAAIEDPDRARKILNECSLVTEECLKEVRSLSYMLHPPLLDELGLESAMRAFVDLYRRRTGVSVDLVCENLGRLRREEELAAFRIAQEGLFNVHHHSASDRAQVRLVRRDNRLEVTVRDWGKGISPEAASSNQSLGIAGMRERARLLGGQLDISPADPGTLVRAEFHVE